MSELRDDIVAVLESWSILIAGAQSDMRDHCTPRAVPAPSVVADRILALLPKVPDAGISWSGFNLSGDRRSIDEVKRLIHVEGRADDLRREVIALRTQAQKVPKLRWEGDRLCLGDLRVGYIAEDHNGQMTLCAGDMAIGGAMPLEIARAAVEAAVRKALGWEA